MNNPQYPTQPGQQPQSGMYPPPSPQKKMSTGAKLGIGCGGAFAALLLIGIIGVAVSGGDDGKTSTQSEKVAAAPKQESKGDAKPAEKKTEPKAQPKPKPATPKSASDRFRAFVAKNGTPTEKAAAQHITKIQGADEQNDIMDSVNIYTDYTGGMMGSHAADGKLIASAFADWKDSKNGLVTIYDAKGEILSNGNF